MVTDLKRQWATGLPAQPTSGAPTREELAETSSQVSPPTPVTLLSEALPRCQHASLILVLYPTEKSKDRGSNTIGARLNRVEDKVGARGPAPHWLCRSPSRGLAPAAAVRSPTSVLSCRAGFRGC